MPVAVTRAVWEDCVAWDDADDERKGTVQHEAGRLWDVLFTLALAVRRNRDTDRVTFRMRRIPRAGRVRAARPVDLWALIGPGDRGEPVLTVMQIGED